MEVVTETDYLMEDEDEVGGGSEEVEVEDAENGEVRGADSSWLLIAFARRGKGC